MTEITDLAAGKAGEYLVCADLILKGHVAFPSEQGLPYDVVADICGRLYRVQVKTTRGLRAVPQRRDYMTGYLFHVGKCGKGGFKSYGESDADLFALVALDTKTISYLPAAEIKRTMIFRAPQNEGKYHDEIMEKRRQAVHADKAAGMRNCDIARKHEIDPSVVGRLLKKTRNTFPASPYLHHLTLDRALGAANDNIKIEAAA